MGYDVFAGLFCGPQISGPMKYVYEISVEDNPNLASLMLDSLEEIAEIAVEDNPKLKHFSAKSLTYVDEDLGPWNRRYVCTIKLHHFSSLY